MLGRFTNKYTVQTNSKLVKAEPDGSQTTIIDQEALMAGPEMAAAYSEIAKDFITHAAVTIGVTYSICKIVGRICQ